MDDSFANAKKSVKSLLRLGQSFNTRLRKFCGRKPLKNLKGSLQFF